MSEHDSAPEPQETGGPKLAPWAAPAKTAWATQVEDEEKNGGPMDFPALGGTDNFPSLGETKDVKQTKPKKKGVKMSMGEFLGAAPSAPAAGVFRAGGRAAPPAEDILSQLPTAPRARAEGDDDRDRRGPQLGGAFNKYGGDRYAREDREGGRRGGFDRDGDRPPREEVGPSRADEADDWGREKKFVPSGSRGGGGGFRDRDEGPSRADDSASWGRERRYEPSRDEDRRGRGGFDDRDRRGGYEPSRADEGDSWGAKKAFTPSDPPGGRRGYGFSDRGGFGDRSSGSPPASAGERPRLKLAPRTKPLDNPLPPPAPKSTLETASSATSSEASVEPKKPKANPFGAARPREEVLKEQGRNVVKEDLAKEHRDALDRPESEEEKELRKQIEELKLAVDDGKGDEPVEEGSDKTLQQKLDDTEVALLKLSAELDDKVRFARSKERF